MCPKCGWPENDRKCSSSSARDVSVPDRVVAKLRLEKAGRGGKTVTVVYDLPRNAQFLKDLCGELKRACGTGGTSTEDTGSCKAIIAIACARCCGRKASSSRVEDGPKGPEGEGLTYDRPCHPSLVMLRARGRTGIHGSQR